MSRKLVLTRVAKREFDLAARWYEKESSSLESQFFEAV